MKKYIVFIAIALTFFQGKAQDKVEIEYPAHVSEVPSSAVKMVAYLDLADDVNWYHEENEDGHSWEAKIAGSHFYNVEFDEEGRFEDIEIDFALDQMPDEDYLAISTTLAENYPHYRIRKIQVQYSALGDFIAAREHGTFLEGDLHRFEIVFETTYNGVYTLKEATLEANGDLVSAREINLESCDLSEY